SRRCHGILLAIAANRTPPPTRANAHLRTILARFTAARRADSGRLLARRIMANDPAPVPQALYRDLLCLPLPNARAEANDYATRGYILLIGDDALLVDTASSTHLPALRSLKDRGRRLSALVLSHGHVVPEDDTLSRLARELGVPILLHPLDADRRRAKAS